MNNDIGRNTEPHLFGRWRFDANTGDLSDGAVVTRLEPQVAKLLNYFLSHQEVLTSRDELIAAAWGGRVVSDDAINRCVSILRHILSPDDKNAYIETVIRRGFVSHFPPAPVAAARVPDAPAQASPNRPGRPPKTAIALATAFAVLAAALLYLGAGIFAPGESLPTGVEQSDSLPMVAVLPLQVTGFAGDAEFFANGVHDDLLTHLAQLQSLRVISRTSMLEYRDTDLSIRQIGEELGADAILEGSVQRIEDHFRINVQLIDAHTDVHLWAERYDRKMLPANVFGVQAEIASAIATAMHSALTTQETERLSVLPTQNMAAYRAYRQAMQVRDADGINTPAYAQSLEEAVALDPTFVRAWAHLAGWLCYRNFSQQDAQSIARIEEILEHIKALAPESADLLVAQAFYTYYIVKDYQQAYELVVQAQNMRPSDERVVELKSWIQRRLGDFDGKAESARLMQTLDPRNPLWPFTLANGLATLHRYDEAMAVIKNTQLDNLELSAMAAMLAVDEHRDFGRWSAAIEALERDFGSDSAWMARWSAQIAARDYAGARRSLRSPSGDRQYSYLTTPSSQFEGATMPLITYWLLGLEDQLMPLLEQVQAAAAMHRDSPNPDYNSDLLLAFVSAAKGEREQAKRFVRLWRREANKDLAELALNRHYACRALGMAAATAEAIDCLRTGLVEPSYVTPFVEPYLPYYDPIRREPEFVALVAKIEQQRLGAH